MKSRTKELLGSCASDYDEAVKMEVLIGERKESEGISEIERYRNQQRMEEIDYARTLLQNDLTTNKRAREMVVDGSKNRRNLTQCMNTVEQGQQAIPSLADYYDEEI